MLVKSRKYLHLPEEGLEPSRFFRAPGFKSSMSANSNIPAKIKLTQTGIEPAYSNYAFNDGLGNRGDTGSYTMCNLKINGRLSESLRNLDLAEIHLGLQVAMHPLDGMKTLLYPRSCLV